MAQNDKRKKTHIPDRASQTSPRPGTVSFLPAFFLLFLCLFTSGCSDGQAPPPQPVQPTVAVSPVKHDHFIFCIDNSKSIKGDEKILIQEIVMLLGDLVDPGDRLSVTAFGRGAELVASQLIQNDRDRIEFKSIVRLGLEFDEDFSDIRAGLKLLAGTPALLNTAQFNIHAILLSDGKLEPADKQTLQAFNEMNSLRDSSLSSIDIYPVALGDEASIHVILRDIEGQDLTGQRLMKQYIARGDNRYFHARNLDQLLAITIEILDRAKGFGELDEQGQANQFRIDDSVESMTLVIKKRNTDGTILCTSADISINPPEDSPAASRQSLYRSGDYRYFDLVTVRRPHEGIWSITLKNGNQPVVLSKIDSPLKLQYRVQDKYYLNEANALYACIFDMAEAKIIPGDRYRIKTRLASGDDLEQSNLYADLHYDEASSQFFLNVPDQLLSESAAQDKPRDIKMQIIAKRQKADSEEMDPWFVRQSPVITVSLAEPFFHWNVPARQLIKLPFMGGNIDFGAMMDSAAKDFPSFEFPPKLTVEIKRYDEKTSSFSGVESTAVESVQTGKNLNFALPRDLARYEPGSYSCQYRLEGPQRDGKPFRVESPGFSFSVISYSYDSGIFRGAVAALIAIIVCFVRAGTATIKGTLSTDGDSVIIHSKRYMSEAQYSNRFSLTAKRKFGIRGGIEVKVISGTITVNGRLLNQGQTTTIAPAGMHTIVHREGSRTIEYQLLAAI